MKALLAFAIGLVMLASAAIVMGVAVAEEDVAVDETAVDETVVVTDEGDGLVIAPAPGTDDGSTDTDDEVTISPGIWPTIVTGYDFVQCNFDDGEWKCGIDLNTGEKNLYFEPGISTEDPYDELYSEDMLILNPLDMLHNQLPSDPSWTFDDITSLPGCPDMFIDMGNIFSDIDTPIREDSPEWWVPDLDLITPFIDDVDWMPVL